MNTRRINGVDMTRHAIDRALDMGIEGQEIRHCILHPERVYASKRYPDTTNYLAGRVVVAIRDQCAVTVGWSSNVLWDEDLSKGEYAGRTYQARSIQGRETCSLPS